MTNKFHHDRRTGPGVHRYDLQETEVPGPLPQSHLRLDPDDGRLLPAGAPARNLDYAVTLTAITLRGTPVTQIVEPGLLTTLRLWKVEQPLRIVSKADGLLPNGDINGNTQAKLAGYGCRHGGTFLVTLLIKATPVEIKLLRNGRLWQTLRFSEAPPDGAWRGEIPALPSPDGICTLGVAPTGLTGSTVFTFQPGS